MIRRLAALLSVAVFGLACSHDTWQGHGVVRDVLPDDHQVVVEHDEIEGLMPGMTMNFHAERPLLLRLEAGLRIDFTLRKRGNVYEIVDFTPVEILAGRQGSVTALAQERDPAPPFQLTDQDGRSLSLADLRGSAVVLDFIFTRCPGPCPILTGIKVQLQKELSSALRARTRLVSITLDPLRDTPAALREYAEARGADLAYWSFLTGPVERVDEVVRAYGVGVIPEPGGDIQHTLATFLIDPDGEIVRRYLGSAHAPSELRAGLEALL